MDIFRHFAWKAFEKTGGVREYLKFKALGEAERDIEVGDELGLDKNLGNSDQNRKVR